MPTSITKLIPVTAKFDGCWCSDKCEHMHSAMFFENYEFGQRWVDYCDAFDQWFDHSNLHERCTKCCDTFGMGEHVKEQEQRDTTMDGVELETMDANDNETLRRWTSE